MISEKIKALVVTEKNKVEVREVSTPRETEGEILVRNEKALICTWEQRIFTGQDVRSLLCRDTKFQER